MPSGPVFDRVVRDYLEAGVGIVGMSVLGLTVAQVLDDIWSLPKLSPAIRSTRANWRSTDCITLSIGPSCPLATFDDDALTQLLVRSHDACLRLAISPASHTRLLLVFSQRERAGDFRQRHPTLEEAVAKVRSRTYYGATIALIERPSTRVSC